MVGPTKRLVEALGDRLAASFAPDIAAQPKTNGSISPINNDLRFAKDKSPYKDHVLLRFWEGPSRNSSPTLFLRVGPNGVGYGSGARLSDLDRWRRLVDDEVTGGALVEAVTGLAKGRQLDFDGQGYKRVPKPFTEDHPRADLLRYKQGFMVRWMGAAAGHHRFSPFHRPLPETVRSLRRPPPVAGSQPLIERSGCRSR